MFLTSTTVHTPSIVISSGENVILPSSHPFRATLTLSKGSSPSFLFPNYPEAQRFGADDELSFSTRDFHVERRSQGNYYVYEIRAASAFQIQADGALHKVDREGQNHFPKETKKPTLLPFSEPEFKAFSQEAQNVSRAAGDIQLAKKIQSGLADLESLLKHGISSDKLSAVFQIRDTLNSSLAQAALNVRETEVPSSAWNLQKKGYSFIIAGGSGQSSPPCRFEIVDREVLTLEKFSRLSQSEDNDPREWSIAQDESVLVSRKRLEDGAYRFNVYLKEGFSGKVNVFRGDSKEATFGIVPSSNANTGTQVLPYRSGGKDAVTQVPFGLIPLLPPERNTSWEVFSKEIQKLESQLQLEGQNVLAERIVSQYRKLDRLTFEQPVGDTELTRKELARLLGQTVRPSRCELVATGGFREVYTGCGWQLSPVYERKEVPGYSPPAIPESPLPRPLPPPLGSRLVLPAAPLLGIMPKPRDLSRGEEKPSISAVPLKPVESKRIDPPVMRTIQEKLGADKGEDAGFSSGHICKREGAEGTSYQLCVNGTKNPGVSTLMFLGKIEGKHFRTTCTIKADGTVEDFRCVGTRSEPKKRLLLIHPDELIEEDSATTSEIRTKSQNRMLELIEEVIRNTARKGEGKRERSRIEF